MPQKWKTSNIRRIHKEKGVEKYRANYIGVGVDSSMGRLFGKAMKKQKIEKKNNQECNK